MPFLAPIIGAAIGGIAATAIGQAVIGAALSIGMAAVARRLAPKPSAQSAGRSAHLRLAVDAEMPRTILFGEAATAGSLVYHNTYDNNKYLELVFALADHECHAMTALWVDGRTVDWDSGTGDVTEYPDMLVRFHAGAWTQSADSDLVANSDGRWSNSERGRGIAYVYVRMKYDAELYKGRQPSFLFVVKGAKLYDWRLDSTAGGSGAHRWGQPATYEWSDNPVVAWYNYRRGLFTNGERIAGMATPADAIPLADATASANACDEAVTLKGGGTEKRYRLSAVVVTAQRHRDVIRDMLATMAGEESDTGGELRILAGVGRSSVMSVTDDDMMAETDVEWSGSHSRRELINAVFGSFRDPVQRFEMVSLVPRVSSADETTDGARQEQRFDLDYVTSETQGQRILEIYRRRARRMLTVRLTFRARMCTLEPGDWITWTSARYGWTSKTFEVVTPQVHRDLSTELVLRETDADVYAWTPATDELDSATVPDLPASGGGTTALSGVAVAVITVASGASGQERPGLTASWTPPADPSIVEVEIQYRRQGDTGDGLLRRAYDAEAGQSSWVDGVQGETTYEVRVRPIALPARATTWSSWVVPASATSQQIVARAIEVSDGAVGSDQLDAQTRFELGLMTAVDEVQGSVAEVRAEALEWANRAGEEALRATLSAHGAKAEIATERTVRATETTALAREMRSATTRLGASEITITEIFESVDGIKGRWGIAINASGHVLGLVQLDGTNEGSTFTVVADVFQVAQPGEDGGDAVPVFTIANVDGVNKLAIRGDMLATGSVLAHHLAAATLTAIKASIDELIAIKIRNAANTSYWDLDTGDFQVTAAS